MNWVDRAYLRVAAQLEQNRGQGLVEYALIIVLVAIVVIGALTALGGSVQTVFETIIGALGGGGGKG